MLWMKRRYTRQRIVIQHSEKNWASFQSTRCRPLWKMLESPRADAVILNKGAKDMQDLGTEEDSRSRINGAQVTQARDRHAGIRVRVVLLLFPIRHQ